MTRHVIHVSAGDYPTPAQIQDAVATVDQPIRRWFTHRIDDAWYVTVVTV